MSLESPTTLRQNLLSVIETTPEADLPELLAIVRDFQQRILDRNPAQIQWQKAILIGSDEHQPIVATSNPKHLSLFVDARDWQDI